MRRDSLMQEKMKHAEEEAAAKAAAEQAALAAARRKAYLASQERRRQYLEAAAEPQLGASRGSLRSTTSSTSLPCLSQVVNRLSLHDPTAHECAHRCFVSCMYQADLSP